MTTASPLEGPRASKPPTHYRPPKKATHAFTLPQSHTRTKSCTGFPHLSPLPHPISISHTHTYTDTHTSNPVQPTLSRWRVLRKLLLELIELSSTANIKAAAHPSHAVPHPSLQWRRARNPCFCSCARPTFIHLGCSPASPRCAAHNAPRRRRPVYCPTLLEADHTTLSLLFIRRCSQAYLCTPRFPHPLPARCRHGF